MKNNFKLFTIIGLLLSVTVWSQAPQKMSYQATLRNNAREIISNQNVGIKVSVLQGSASGAIVYQEIQNTKTNENGLVSIEIGTGILKQGNFKTIDWSTGVYYIQTETDPLGGVNYSIKGSTQLMSVPYAFYSEKSGNGGSTSGTGTNNYIGKFNTSGTSIGNSQLFDNGINVGIGTNAPTATLHVIRGSGANGTVQFEGNKNHSHFNYSSTEDTYIRGGSDGSKVYINDSDLTGDVIMSIPTNSNVGIGTSTPTTKLQINGVSYASGYTSGFRFDDRTLTQDVVIGGNNNNKWEWYATEGSARLYDHQNNIDRFKIENNGKVAVNSNGQNLVSTFSVYGTIGNSTAEFYPLAASFNALTNCGSVFNYLPEDSSGKRYSTFIRGGAFGSKVWLNDAHAGDVIIANGGGNVGIGTADPTYRLSVNGGLRAKEIRVDSDWADFVFEKEYKLRPLAEVEKYILEHKHLPEIPAAKEIEGTEGGLNVGEMSKLFMQKIEELTLYMIEANKQIENNNKQIQELKKENEVLKNSISKQQ